MSRPALSRRRVLQAAGLLGAAAGLRPRGGAAQEARVLRVRASADLQVLDPAHRKGQPEGDIGRAMSAFQRLRPSTAQQILDFHRTHAQRRSAAKH